MGIIYMDDEKIPDMGWMFQDNESDSSGRACSDWEDDDIAAVLAGRAPRTSRAHRAKTFRQQRQFSVRVSDTAERFRIWRARKYAEGRAALRVAARRFGRWRARKYRMYRGEVLGANWKVATAFLVMVGFLFMTVAWAIPVFVHALQRLGAAPGQIFFSGYEPQGFFSPETAAAAPATATLLQPTDQGTIVTVTTTATVAVATVTTTVAVPVAVPTTVMVTAAAATSATSAAAAAAVTALPHVSLTPLQQVLAAVERDPQWRDRLASVARRKGIDYDSDQPDPEQPKVPLFVMPPNRAAERLMSRARQFMAPYMSPAPTSPASRLMGRANQDMAPAPTSEAPSTKILSWFNKYLAPAQAPTSPASRIMPRADQYMPPPPAPTSYAHRVVHGLNKNLGPAPTGDPFTWRGLPKNLGPAPTSAAARKIVPRYVAGPSSPSTLATITRAAAGLPTLAVTRTSPALSTGSEPDLVKRGAAASGVNSYRSGLANLVRGAAIIVLVVGCLRILFRYRNSNTIFREDVLYFAGVLIFIPMCVVIDQAVHKGLGSPISMFGAFGSNHNGFDTLKLDLLCRIAIVLFLVVHFTTKTSIIFYYMRCFGRYESLNVMAMLAIFAQVIVNGPILAISLIVIILRGSCSNWGIVIPVTGCIDYAHVLYANVIFNFLLDLAVTVMPFPYVFRLNIPANAKLVAIILYAMGGGASLMAAAGRMTSIGSLSDGDILGGQTLTLVPMITWTVAECALGLICASLLHLRLMLARTFPDSLGHFFNFERDPALGVGLHTVYGGGASNSSFENMGLPPYPGPPAPAPAPPPYSGEPSPYSGLEPADAPLTRPARAHLPDSDNCSDWIPLGNMDPHATRESDNLGTSGAVWTDDLTTLVTQSEGCEGAGGSGSAANRHD